MASKDIEELKKILDTYTFSNYNSNLPAFSITANFYNTLKEVVDFYQNLIAFDSVINYGLGYLLPYQQSLKLDDPDSLNMFFNNPNEPLKRSIREYISELSQLFSTLDKFKTKVEEFDNEWKKLPKRVQGKLKRYLSINDYSPLFKSFSMEFEKNLNHNILKIYENFSLLDEMGILNESIFSYDDSPIDISQLTQEDIDNIQQMDFITEPVSFYDEISNNFFDSYPSMLFNFSYNDSYPHSKAYSFSKRFHHVVDSDIGNIHTYKKNKHNNFYIAKQSIQKKRYQAIHKLLNDDPSIKWFSFKNKNELNYILFFSDESILFFENSYPQTISSYLEIREKIFHFFSELLIEKYNKIPAIKRLLKLTTSDKIDEYNVENLFNIYSIILKAPYLKKILIHDVSNLDFNRLLVVRDYSNQINSLSLNIINRIKHLIDDNYHLDTELRVILSTPKKKRDMVQEFFKILTANGLNPKKTKLVCSIFSDTLDEALNLILSNYTGIYLFLLRETRINTVNRILHRLKRSPDNYQIELLADALIEISEDELYKIIKNHKDNYLDTINRIIFLGNFNFYDRIKLAKKRGLNTLTDGGKTIVWGFKTQNDLLNIAPDVWCTVGNIISFDKYFGKNKEQIIIFDDNPKEPYKSIVGLTVNYNEDDDNISVSACYDLNDDPIYYPDVSEYHKYITMIPNFSCKNIVI